MNGLDAAVGAFIFTKKLKMVDYIVVETRYNRLAYETRRG